MKIFTKIIFNLRVGNGYYETEDYEGPVVYAGGGGDVVNETVPTGPFGPQIPFILGLFEQAAQLFNQGAPQAFPGVDPTTGQVGPGGQLTPTINQNLTDTQQGIAGLTGGNIAQNTGIQDSLVGLAGQQNPGAQLGQALTPGIVGGINAQLDAGGNPLTGSAANQLGNQQGAFNTVFGQQPGQVQAGGTQGGAANANPAIQQLLAGGGGQNPFLDQLVQGSIQGQVDSFNRNVLPGISSEAQQAGQLGGSRQGIAEGIAANDLTTAIANSSANIYGNAFNTQVGAQGNALNSILGAQQADQSAGLQAGGINNQNYQQYIQSLLQGTGQVGGQLGQGLGLGYGAIGSGTAQAGNLFSGGNALQLQQQLGSLGLIPGFQGSSLGQFGAQNQLGLQQYGLDQASIDALSNQYNFNQNAPYNALSQYQQFITGPYGSSVSPQATSPNFVNPIGPNAGQLSIPGFQPTAANPFGAPSFVPGVGGPVQPSPVTPPAPTPPSTAPLTNPQLPPQQPGV